MKKPTCTLALRMVDDVNGSGTPNHGDTVTFDVSAPGVVTPNVTLRAYQNDVLVFSAWSWFYDGAPWSYARDMVLASTRWPSGGAHCIATLDDGSLHAKPLATLEFEVEP